MQSSFSRQSGVALIAALLLMTSIMFILGNIFYRHQINIAQSTLAIHQDQAYLLALSAESWARQLLEEDAADSQADHFEELWAQAIPAMPVEGGIVNGCISDLQGRFNINSLYYKSPSELKNALNGDESSFAKTWNNLLRYLDIPVYPGRIEAIVDWLDPNSTKVGPDGAEQEEYSGFYPPRTIADAPMVEAGELASVLGYEVFEVQRLMPWLTALPVPKVTPGQSTKSVAININTASEELLLGLGDIYDIQFRDTVIANRPFETLNDFHSLLEFELALPIADIVRRWPEDVISVASQFFELYIEVTLGEARIEVRSIIMRSSSADSGIISRELIAVPAKMNKDSVTELLEKMTAGNNLGSDKNSDSTFDDEQVLPACAMIGA
jgi:general secretion pathway protein K